MTNSLREAWRFFQEHAGGIVGQSAIGALSLARAEAQAKERRLTFEWDEDSDADLSWCDTCAYVLDVGRRESVRREKVEHYQSHTQYYCLAKGPDGTVLASLCGIDFGSGRGPWSKDPYCREVEAQLASEALALLAADYADGMEDN